MDLKQKIENILNMDLDCYTEYMNSIQKTENTLNCIENLNMQHVIKQYNDDLQKIPFLHIPHVKCKKIIELFKDYFDIFITEYIDNDIRKYINTTIKLSIDNIDIDRISIQIEMYINGTIQLYIYEFAYALKKSHVYKLTNEEIKEINEIVKKCFDDLKRVTLSTLENNINLFICYDINQSINNDVDNLINTEYNDLNDEELLDGHMDECIDNFNIFFNNSNTLAYYFSTEINKQNEQNEQNENIIITKDNIKIKFNELLNHFIQIYDTLIVSNETSLNNESLNLLNQILNNFCKAHDVDHYINTMKIQTKELSDKKNTIDTSIQKNEYVFYSTDEKTISDSITNLTYAYECFHMVSNELNLSNDKINKSFQPMSDNIIDLLTKIYYCCNPSIFNELNAISNKLNSLNDKIVSQEDQNNFINKMKEPCCSIEDNLKKIYFFVLMIFSNLSLRKYTINPITIIYLYAMLTKTYVDSHNFYEKALSDMYIFDNPNTMVDLGKSYSNTNDKLIILMTLYEKKYIDYIINSNLINCLVEFKKMEKENAQFSETIINYCDTFLKTKNMPSLSNEYSEIESFYTIKENIQKINRIYSSQT